MKGTESIASRNLRIISETMNYEILLSRPGISEPDSHFIWASSFKAPIGFSFIRDDLYFNLFLPEGSENEADKKIFLNRVGAKFQDNLWQVRRSTQQVKGIYGGPFRSALSLFKSMLPVCSYIKRGCIYVYLAFNDSELPEVSATLLSLSDKIGDLHLELMRKTKGKMAWLDEINEGCEMSSVTIEARLKNEPTEGSHEDNDFYFVVGSILREGAKAVAKSGNGVIPALLEPVRISDIGRGIITFETRNQLILDLVELMALDYIVVYSIYGSASSGTMHLTVNVPSQQTNALLRLLGRLNEKPGYWYIALKEVSSLRDLSQTFQF